MALLTGAALLVGIVIVAIAVLSQNQPRLSDRLVQPAFDVPAGLADGRTLGKADAPVTLQIWSDFQCPACQVFSTQTEPSVVTTFVIP
ncbi:MAG TPA: thioredoxin domain-containing protein, partial [Candidatus Limnocylindrales bacterium]